MKKILTAFIEPVIQFDTEQECSRYLEVMKRCEHPVCKVMDKKTDAAGKVFLTVRKQYNNNVMPE